MRGFSADTVRADRPSECVATAASPPLPGENPSVP